MDRRPFTIECMASPTEGILGRLCIHLDDGRLLSIRRSLPRGSIAALPKKIRVETTPKILQEALRVFAGKAARNFLAGMIVPDYSAIDDRTLQIPFIGVIVGKKLLIFYKPRQVFETPTTLSLIALSGKRPVRETEAWLTEPLAVTG